MAALNFPPEPIGQNTGTQYTGSNGVAYIWDGYKWVGHSPTLAPGSNSISNNGNVVQVDQSGNLRLPNYTLPVNGGIVGQSLTWPSSGTTLAWTTATGGGLGANQSLNTTDNVQFNDLILAGTFVTSSTVSSNGLILTGQIVTPGHGVGDGIVTSNGLGNLYFDNDNSLYIIATGTYQTSFNADGTVTFPGYVFPLATGANGQVLVAGDNPLFLEWQDLKNTRWDATAVEPNGCPIFAELTPDHFQAYTQGSHIEINNDGTWDIGSNYNGVGLYSLNNTATLYSNSGDIIVRTNNNNYWRFDGTGTLTLPTGYSIGGNTNGNDGIALTTDRGTILFGNHPECVPTAQTHFHIMKEDTDNVELFFGDDNNYVKLPGTQTDSYGVEVGTNGGSGANIWRFGTDGVLTMPDGAISGNDGRIDFNFEGYNWGRISSHNRQVYIHSVEDNGPYPAIYGTGTVLTELAVGLDVSISTNAQTSPNNWVFGIDGTTRFPNNTLDAGTSTIIIKSTDFAELEYFNDNFQELPNEVGNAFVGVDSSGPYMANLALNSSGTDANLSTWSVDSNGNLVTAIIHEISTSTDVGDIVDIDGNSIIYTIASETPPARAPAGRLWYNSVEGRMYIRYEDLWVDASPTVVPSVSTYLDGLTVDGTTISSDDSTGTVSIQTGVSNEWTFGLDGILTFPYGGVIEPDGGESLLVSASGGVGLVSNLTGSTGTVGTLNWSAVFTDYNNGGPTGVGIQTGLFGDPPESRKEWVFDGGGSLTLPPGSTSTIQSGQIFSQVNSGFLNLDVQFNSDVYGGVRMGTAANRPVDIVTNFEISPNVWRFGTDSTLTLPTGGEILDISGLGPGLSTGFIDPNGITVGTAPGNDITFTTSDGVGLYSNSNLWQFGTDGTTTLPGPINNILVGTTSTNGSGDPAYPTALNITKSVNKLSDNIGSTYTLADGVEGQIMYLVPQTGATMTGVNVTVNHARILDNSTSTALVVIDALLSPFNSASTPVPTMGVTTLIFTDGAWQADAGFWDY